MENMSDVLMLRGTLYWCADCAGERIFVPVVDGHDFEGCEFCCTSCDAAVFIMTVPGRADRPAPRRVA